jgi:hypothetical protein
VPQRKPSAIYRPLEESGGIRKPRGPLRRTGASIGKWLLKGQTREVAGPHEQEGHHPRHPWWQVMCLTGVDYFSTLGYQPGIAALAAGALSPLATLILVLVTMFGALPMYKRVAAASPHGDGSISMLEHLLTWWKGKLLVLALIGFVATGFVITITLSAADATAHITENPFTSFLHGYEVPITLLLIILLGAVFMKGFGEAIKVAIALVAIYLALNVVIIIRGLIEIASHPSVISDWRTDLTADYGNPLLMVGAAMLLFPKLALGLSGFETGVVVMPLVEGDESDTEREPAGRIRNTHKLLTTAALIMSVLLLTSSVVTTLLIPHEEFEEGGGANGRALAYLAHEFLGDGLGTVYDLSTITILWFAGASALAGLLNIVPRYLPRYGMAPDWARATRPLVVIFTLICALVTILFKADVDAQAGAYATGVLAVITSATIAVTLQARHKQNQRATIGFGLVALIFIYTTAITIFGDLKGLQIASFFITGIVVVSLVSRTARSTELRVNKVVFDPIAEELIAEAARSGTIRLIANHPDERTHREYLLKEREERAASHIPEGDAVLFLEVTVRDASEFNPSLEVHGHRIGGYRVLRTEGAAIPNAIAAVLLEIRDRTQKQPHIYFGWSEGNPLKYLARFVLFGEGDVAPVTHEILRKAEPFARRRPAIHVG